MSNNKQLAKNTMLLYARTFITMLISLYLSRVIIQQLGVSDFGVYNVIGGFVAMLSALTSPLGGGTQRFITYAIGEHNIVKIKKVFTASLFTHVILAVASFLLIEFVGLWYLDNKLNIPDGRLYAAHLVFQTALLSLFISIITVPFSAAVIAYEKFSFYAWNFIILSLVRLALISLLAYSNHDKLILYSFFELTAQLISNGLFIFYCIKNLKGCKPLMRLDLTIVKNILTFSGWNFLGTSSSLMYSQGSGVLLNSFLGVLVNAAMGVATQVQNAIASFVTNFTTAINPQITKAYADGNYDETNRLIFFGTKISVYLFLIISFPFFLNIELILRIWLVEVPLHAAAFIKLLLLVSLIGIYSNALHCTVFATGRIKYYQILSIVSNVLALCMLYFSLLIGFSPNVIYIIMIVQGIAKVIYLLPMVKKATGISIKSYLSQIVLRSAIILLFLWFIYYIRSIVSIESTVQYTICESILSMFIAAVFIYWFGLLQEDRIKVNLMFKKILIKYDCKIR